MPALGVHAVGDVVDVEVTSGEGDDGDEGAAEHLELHAEGGGRRYVFGDLLGTSDDLDARVDVPGLTDSHHAGPASGDEGTGAGTRDAGGSVHAAGPVGGDKVLVRAQLLGAVEDGGAALGREAVLVRVAGDRGDALEAEVEKFSLKTGLVEERDQERTQTAVYMQR